MTHTEWSMQTHKFRWHEVFEFQGTVELFLLGHKRCTPGPDATVESCSSKAALLMLADAMGWNLDVPMLNDVQAREVQGAMQDG